MAAPCCAEGCRAEARCTEESCVEKRRAGEECRGRLAPRLFGAAARILPGAALIMLPKCPLCIAAWVAACTGVALPAVVAGSVQPLLVVACVVSASLVVLRVVARLRMARGPGFNRIAATPGGFSEEREAATGLRLA